MTQFINAKENVVTEAIDGLLATSSGSLSRLDGYPHIKVLVRSDWDKSKVALISGGGSGHEPAHAGFVGPGMLTAAVCGEVFASPSVDAVLAGILAVTGEAGCLLIVKNYTGDRLNFGLAAEHAKALGHAVEISDVTAAARGVIHASATIGMSLDTCTVPGATKEDRIAPDHAELGLGIHGEPGVEQVACTNAKTAMQHVLDKLAPHMNEGPVVALLNNLGGTTPVEMAWPGLHSVSAIPLLAVPTGIAPTKPAASENAAHRALLDTVCNLLINAESELNALDAKSGDGDTGSTLAGAARALLQNLDSLPLADEVSLLRALGNELSQSMGGSSGVILGIFFNAAADANTQVLDQALLKGLARVSEVGGAEAGHRTMIDALQPALQTLPNGLAEAAKAARQGANATANMGRAKAGRAAYVPEENLIGHNDPGAEAVALVFEALARN